MAAAADRIIQVFERYLNPVAQLFILAVQAYRILVAGRGFSKSFTNGLIVARYVEMMPRSVGLFCSPSYSMIYTKTLLPMKAAWEQHMGYIEGIHYVVGKAPPKGFKTPYHKPQRYENVVTFFNGTTIVFGSFDRPALISGGSYDWAITDEAYLIDKEDYDNYVIPCMRGTHPSFQDCPCHLQQTFTTSMPYRNQGDWVMDFYQKAKQNPDMYFFIGWEPNADVQLGSTWMNVQVMGVRAILQMQAEMNENNYHIMIENQQVTNWGNLFYPSLSPHHFYRPKANDLVASLSLQQLAKVKRNATFDIGPDDYDPDRTINISHDWGKFNCITIDQEFDREVRVINAMHVLNPQTIDDLADDFIAYYKDHRAKLVRQWGDKTGRNRQPNAKQNYFEQFASRLRDAGWRVVLKKTGDIDHLERHRFISNMMKGDDQRLPIVRFNDVNCADLRIALESAPMKDDKKDKSSENNRSIKPQHATHYTDALDYRLYHGFKDYKRAGMDFGGGFASR